MYGVGSPKTLGVPRSMAGGEKISVKACRDYAKSYDKLMKRKNKIVNYYNTRYEHGTIRRFCGLSRLLFIYPKISRVMHAARTYITGFAVVFAYVYVCVSIESMYDLPMLVRI